jgi:ATP synthase protein I
MSRSGARPDGPNGRPGPNGRAGPNEGTGWTVMSYLIGGMALYGGIGWLIGRWTGIAALFPVGMLFGLGLALTLVVLRFGRP